MCVAEIKKNETHFGIVFGKGVEHVKNNPHPHSGWHLLEHLPIDLLVKSFSELLLEPPYHCALEVFVQSDSIALWKLPEGMKHI